MAVAGQDAAEAASTCERRVTVRPPRLCCLLERVEALNAHRTEFVTRERIRPRPRRQLPIQPRWPSWTFEHVTFTSLIAPLALEEFLDLDESRSSRSSSPDVRRK